MGGKRKPGGETATEQVKEKKSKKAAQQADTPAEDIFDVSQYIVETKMLPPDLLRIDEELKFGEVTLHPPSLCLLP